MSFQFHKMHGAGNDFVLIDARNAPFALDAARAALIADRHRGIGCDQILVLRETGRDGCLLRYEIWNADGSRRLSVATGRAASASTWSGAAKPQKRRSPWKAQPAR